MPKRAVTVIRTKERVIGPNQQPAMREAMQVFELSATLGDLLDYCSRRDTHSVSVIFEDEDLSPDETTN